MATRRRRRSPGRERRIVGRILVAVGVITPLYAQLTDPAAFTKEFLIWGTFLVITGGAAISGEKSDANGPHGTAAKKLAKKALERVSDLLDDEGADVDVPESGPGRNPPVQRAVLAS